MEVALLRRLTHPSRKDGSIARLNGAAAFADDINRCATRYVLSDELVSLCTALAYSKGASTLACADLLHVPAERMWIEWAEAPWQSELARYGFKRPEDSHSAGRRGVFIQSTAQGRSGLLRAFWASGESEMHVLCGSMEAYFDFDTPEDEEPEVFDRRQAHSIGVADGAIGDADILRQCFRFRFERSWQDYYEKAGLTSGQATAISRHALGTMVLDIPLFCRSTNPLGADLQGHLHNRAGFTMCEDIWCGVAVSCSGGSRTCGAVRGSDPFGPAQSPGSSMTNTIVQYRR
jgi:hypothetical protein